MLPEREIYCLNSLSLSLAEDASSLSAVASFRFRTVSFPRRAFSARRFRFPSSSGQFLLYQPDFGLSLSR